MALQEMNLYHKYGEVYWNAACLTVNSSASEDGSSGSADYGKIASSISNMQKYGVKIDLPDINIAGIGFKPNSANNSILFGFKAINGIGDSVVSDIVANRPYTSIQDFYERIGNTFSDSQCISLVKAGCFDSIGGENRIATMGQMIKEIAIKGAKIVKNTNMTMFREIIKTVPYVKEMYPEVEPAYNFYKYVTQTKFLKTMGAGVAQAAVFILDERATVFFEKHFQDQMVYGKDYFDKDGQKFVFDRALGRVYKKIVKPFSSYVKSSEKIIRALNQSRFDVYTREVWDKYCTGSIPKWEMDALSFYHSRHELGHLRVFDYGISDYFKLSPTPTVGEVFLTKRGEYTQYLLYKIVGTVLDKDKTRNTVTLLTPTGVVTVNFYKEMFGEYNKQISAINSEGKKSVVDKSWFSRGTKLQIMGFRRDDVFVPRKYKNSVYQHIVSKITSIDDFGYYEITTKRPNGVVEDEEQFN